MTKKNILITGSKGFIGKNLIKELSAYNIYEFHRESSLDDLSNYISDIDFIFHLAGEVRPNSTKEEFEKSNVSFTRKLIQTIEKNNLHIPILVSSSKHAINPKNDYGSTKKIADDLLIQYAKKNHTNVYIYRLPHLFGEGCKANHNSAITTWIYNSINNLPINIYSRDIPMQYTYVKDFVKDAIEKIDSNENDIFYSPNIIHNTTLGEVYDKILSLKEKTYTLDSDFMRKLYLVYTWYKEQNK